MNRFIKLSIIIALLIVNIGCKKKDREITLEDLQNETRSKLLGTWNPIMVSRDNMDVTSDYSNFTLDFSQTSFTTSNGGEVWPASSNWDFRQGSFMVIIRSDLTEISLDFSDNDTRVTMSFTLVDSGGRITSFAGQYIFLMEN